MAALETLAREWKPLIFPVHPRTRRSLDLLGHVPGDGLMLCEPLGYLEFLSLELGAAACITDSGGECRRAAALGVRCFTLRSNTERPVTLACGNHLLGVQPEAIAEIPRLYGEALTGSGRAAGTAAPGRGGGGPALRGGPRGRWSRRSMTGATGTALASHAAGRRWPLFTTSVDCLTLEETVREVERLRRGRRPAPARGPERRRSS